MLWSIDTCQNKVFSDHIEGLILELIEVSCFLKLTADHVLSSIGSQAQARLT